MNEVDTPILNLRSKKFSKVRLLCFDEVIEFTTNEEEHRLNIHLGETSVYDKTLCIEIHKEHLEWIDHGKTNILPYSSIIRWVLD